MTNLAVNGLTSNTLKRKWHSASMPPRLRQYTDEQTGEVLRIETTKQAKRRHQRSGGAQWKPTPGQINAADIWNKQEEKIKKDREREERKKRNAARQAEKDAEQRRKQEELLRKGKISIEDTWAKVSASQNRLNKFFCPPSKPGPTFLPEESNNREGDNEAPHTADETNVTPKQCLDRALTHTLQAIDKEIDEDLGDYLTNSPLTQKTPQAEIEVRASLAARQAALGSQILMPPPPRRIASANNDSKLVRRSPPVAFKHSSPMRSPLSELSPVQLNTRVLGLHHSESSCAHSSPSRVGPIVPPLSTQIVSDTLAGLSSQDFEDDFTEGKENRSPCYTRSCQMASTMLSYTPPHKIAHGSCPATMVNMTINKFSSPDHNEFDDGDIDDDALLSLAATQKVKKEFFASVKSCAASYTTASTARISKSPNCNFVTTATVTPDKFVPKASDSFTFTDIDDDDLLRAVEDFETDTDDLNDQDLLRCMESFEAKQDPPRKKRRVKPWDKFPIDMSA